jgi:hypothetical protein
METTTIIVNNDLAIQIEVAKLFDDCPFKQATVIRLSNDSFYVDFQTNLSNSTLFKYGMFIGEKNSLPLDLTFIDLPND